MLLQWGEGLGDGVIELIEIFLSGDALRNVVKLAGSSGAWAGLLPFPRQRRQKFFHNVRVEALSISAFVRSAIVVRKLARNWSNGVLSCLKMALVSSRALPLRRSCLPCFPG